MHPPTGTTYWLTMPAVSIAAMEAALAALAQERGIDAAHRVVLVVDRAGWHTSERLALLEGLTLCFLPAYTPQPKPAERLRPLVREAIANWTVSTDDELERVVGTRCVTPHDDAMQVCRATNYHWWPWC